MMVTAMIIQTVEEETMEEDTTTMMMGTTIETTTGTMIEIGAIRLLPTEAAEVAVAVAVEIGIMRKIMEEVEWVVGMAIMMMRADIVKIMMIEVEDPHRA